MASINFTPFPVLNTERLTLRQLEFSDDLVISELRSNEEVNRYIDRVKQTNVQEAGEFILRLNQAIKENKSLYWAICLKKNNELIGTACLWNFSEDNSTAEIGYELSPDYQGKGLMNEAFTKVIEYCFNTLGLQMLEAVVHNDNNKSLRLLEKNKFRLDKLRKVEDNIKMNIYTLTKT